MSEFVTVAKVSDIPEGEGRCFEVGGHKVGVFNLGGEFHAIDDICTHAHASLSEGDVEGDEVTCPLHFASFNIRTGECLSPPADEDVRSHVVRVEGDEIQVQTP